MSHSAFTKFDSPPDSCRMGSKRMRLWLHLSHCAWVPRGAVTAAALHHSTEPGHSCLAPITHNSRLCLQCGVFPSLCFLGVMYNLVKELNILQVLTRNREVSGTEYFHTDFIISLRCCFFLITIWQLAEAVNFPLRCSSLGLWINFFLHRHGWNPSPAEKS